MAARLKLSNKARKRVALAADRELSADPESLAYWIGIEGATDRLLLAGRAKDAAAVSNWRVPKLPITGGQLIKRGVTQGPLVAKTLQAIEREWVAEGFPSGDDLESIVSKAVAAI